MFQIGRMANTTNEVATTATRSPVATSPGQKAMSMRTATATARPRT